jgi:hypothetical protein
MATGLFPETKGADIRHFPTKASLSDNEKFYAGDFLKISTIGTTGGVIRMVSSASAVEYDSDDGFIVGMAMEDSHDDAGIQKKNVKVAVASPGALFKTCIYHPTASSAYPNADTQLGVNYEMWSLASSSNRKAGWAINVEVGNTKLVARIADYVSEQYGNASGNWPNVSAVATTSASQYGEVWIEFLAAQCAFGGSR